MSQNTKTNLLQASDSVIRFLNDIPTKKKENENMHEYGNAEREREHGGKRIGLETKREEKNVQ